MNLLSVTHFSRTGAAAAATAMGLTLPISTAGDNLLFAACLLLWTLSGDWRGKLSRGRANPVVLAIVLFLAWAALGMLWGEGPGSERLRNFGKYSSLFLAVMMITLPAPRSHCNTGLRLFLAAMGLTVLVTTMLRFEWMPAGLFSERTPDVPVAFKLYITQNLFMAIACITTTIAAIHARAKRIRITAAAFALLTLGGLLMVPSGRTGYLALGVGVAFLCLRLLDWRRLLLLTGVVALLGAVLWQSESITAVQRFKTGFEQIESWRHDHESSHNTSMGLRLDYAKTSLRIIAANPLAGVGTGGFESAYSEMITGSRIAPSNNPHNQFLLTTAQLGLPGLLLLLGLAVTIWRAAKQLPPPWRLLAHTLLLMMAAGNLFNSFLYDHAESMFSAWILGILFSAAPNLSLQRDHQEQDRRRHQ